MINLKRLLVVVASVLFCITASSCKQKAKTKEEEFRALLININESREVFHKKPLPNIENYNVTSPKDDVVFGDGELEAMIVSGSQKLLNENKVLTRKEALSDVESLFKIFKSAYSLYYHFGGDTIFAKAKEETITELNKVEEISNGSFMKLLKSKLVFIKDGHFNIGKIDELKLYYSYEGEVFFKDDKGIYKVNNNKKYYLRSVDSKENIEDFLKLTINDNGELVYILGFNKVSDVEIDYTKPSFNYSVPIEELPIEVCYESKGEKFQEVVKFKTDKEVNYQYKESLDLEITDNIPVVTFNKINGSLSTTMISKVTEKLKEYNIAVIDLRGNTGGNMDLVNRFSDKMNIPYTTKRARVQMYSKPILLQQQLMLGNKFISNHKLNEFVIEEKFDAETSLADNDRLIIALVDVNVASSGEGIIRRLSTMKNVILVGTNTNGANLAYNICRYKLPNSNAIVNLGSGIYVCADIDKFELNGFTPDIWANSNDALDKVIKFIKLYGLENFKN